MSGDVRGKLGERLGDVRVGPDGALYLLTDSTEGRVLRVRPKRAPQRAGLLPRAAARPPGPWIRERELGRANETPACLAQPATAGSRARLSIMASMARRMVSTSRSVNPFTAIALTSAAMGTSVRLSRRPLDVRKT